MIALPKLRCVHLYSGPATLRWTTSSVIRTRSSTAVTRLRCTYRLVLVLFGVTAGLGWQRDRRSRWQSCEWVEVSAMAEQLH
jgi:hypothetical protein